MLCADGGGIDIIIQSSMFEGAFAFRRCNISHNVAVAGTGAPLPLSP